MAKVKLIDYTGKGNPDDYHAARMLVFTKATRMSLENAWEGILKMDSTALQNELLYMASTIPSSWEFADCTFLITQVSRSTCQQITRTRTGSYAMQSQRVIDMGAATYDDKGKAATVAMEEGITNYRNLVGQGVPLEDAREVLPIGVHSAIVCKYNFRNLVELCMKRNSLRVQDQYRDIIENMRMQVLNVWPWAEPFFVPKQSKAIALLEEAATALRKLEGLDGAMYNGISGKLAKAADLMKV